MVDCSKRQHEIYKGTEQHRCIHRDATTFLEIVTEDVCESCPLRMSRIKPEPPCSKPTVHASPLVEVKPFVATEWIAEQEGIEPGEVMEGCASCGKTVKVPKLGPVKKKKKKP